MGKVKERLIQGYYCTDCGKELGKPEELGQRCCLECDNFNTAFNAVEMAFRKQAKKEGDKS